MAPDVLCNHNCCKIGKGIREGASCGIEQVVDYNSLADAEQFDFLPVSSFHNESVEE